MKIAVVGANGRTGNLIVEEALNRGVDVTAIVRGENKTNASKVLIKDVFDLSKDDLVKFDVVVDAIGAWTEDSLNVIPDAVKYLAEILENTDVRLLVVGGAGSLYTDGEKTVTVADAPDFPEIFKPVASVHQSALNHLRKQNNLKWTYVSPAADYQADGKRSGEYILAGEYFTLNDRGESVISYADYAIAMLDEIESGNHIRERISVLGK